MAKSCSGCPQKKSRTTKFESVNQLRFYKSLDLLCFGLRAINSNKLHGKAIPLQFVLFPVITYLLNGSCFMINGEPIQRKLHQRGRNERKTTFWKEIII